MDQKKPKPTIEELEAILNDSEDTQIVILPSGEIRTNKIKKDKDPLLGNIDLPYDY